MVHQSNLPFCISLLLLKYNWLTLDGVAKYELIHGLNYCRSLLPTTLKYTSQDSPNGLINPAALHKGSTAFNFFLKFIIVETISHSFLLCNVLKLALIGLRTFWRRAIL